MDEITISRTEYLNSLIDAAEVGAQKALIEIGQLSPVIKRTEAERTYKTHIIKALLKAEMIKLYKNGERNSATYFDRLELISAIKTYYKILKTKPQQK